MSLSSTGTTRTRERSPDVVVVMVVVIMVMVVMVVVMPARCVRRRDRPQGKENEDEHNGTQLFHGTTSNKESFCFSLESFLFYHTIPCGPQVSLWQGRQK